MTYKRGGAAVEEWSELEQEQRRQRVVRSAIPQKKTPMTLLAGSLQHADSGQVSKRLLQPKGPKFTLQRVSTIDEDYSEVERLTRRFFHPISHALLASRTSSTEHQLINPPSLYDEVNIVSVDRLVSSISCQQLDQPSALSQQRDIAVSDSNNLRVKKFTYSFDEAVLLRTGAPNAVVGPAGLGYYFPNTYDSAGSSVGNDDATPEKAILLCEVNCGKMSMGKGSANSEELLRLYQSLAGTAEDISAMRSVSNALAARGGYSSLSVAVDGAPHIAMFEPSRVRPLFLVRYYRKPRSASTTTEVLPPRNLYLSSDSSELREDVAPSPTAGRPPLGLPIRRSVHAGREHSGGSNAILAARIRQQCKDLIETVCAKREELLAQLLQQQNDSQLIMNEFSSEQTIQALAELQRQVEQIKLVKTCSQFPVNNRPSTSPSSVGANHSLNSRSGRGIVQQPHLL